MSIGHVREEWRMPSPGSLARLWASATPRRSKRPLPGLGRDERASRSAMPMAQQPRLGLHVSAGVRVHRLVTACDDARLLIEKVDGLQGPRWKRLALPASTEWPLEELLWDHAAVLAKPRIKSAGDDRSIHWDLGTLQFAPTLNGPWTDLPAASPFNLRTLGDLGFFRVKVER